ncbi:MAG: competence/damage-inducible protein A [Lachnospiraceae bacterium]|nr:competence/damage-inducible protein A [Lachnospiraceae bacterium]
MVVELVSVGTEILLGNIVNTNAAYLSEKCAGLGLSCYYQSVVGDNAKRLFDTIKTATERADIVILSGGLGPTEDDLTKETATKVFEKELFMDKKIKEQIQKYFAKRGTKPTDNNWKQAMVPEGAIAVENDNGTAPGIIMEKDGKRMILLPGPPNELIPMFEKSIVPYLEALQPGVIYSKTVKVCGIGESKAETMISDLIANQTNPTIATYAKTGEVHLRVTASADTEKEAKKLIKPVVKELKYRFEDAVYSTEEDVTLEQSIVELLKKNKLTVATAESCTGGMVAARLVNVPGVSDCLKVGYITYADKAKRKLLGVRKGLLKKKGAVSFEVAEEMAKGAALFSKADVTIATTGIAGPDGGSDEKPVGLVYIACNVKGKVKVKECHFSGNRMKVRESTVANALIFMRECILEYCNEMEYTRQGK